MIIIAAKIREVGLSRNLLEVSLSRILLEVELVRRTRTARQSSIRRRSRKKSTPGLALNALLKTLSYCLNVRCVVLQNLQKLLY